MERTYVKMSLFQSILADFFCIVILIGGVLFNQKFCGGSYFVNAIILIFLMLTLYGLAKYVSEDVEFKKD